MVLGPLSVCLCVCVCVSVCVPACVCGADIISLNCTVSLSGRITVCITGAYYKPVERCVTRCDSGGDCNEPLLCGSILN